MGVEGNIGGEGEKRVGEQKTRKRTRKKRNHASSIT